MEHLKPDPDRLLEIIKENEKKQAEGRLRIFLGMSAGVGKTYSMLLAAHQKIEEGFDVVVGTIETHGRKETEEKLVGLPVIPRKVIEHRGVQIEEMDLEAILARKPQIVLVDELAHTNAPDSRHPKRWQDVIELLESGIDVFSAVNIQHIESRKDDVESITDVVIHETIPDSILERANQIEVIDIPPADLLKRLKEGKVYLADKAEQAADNFFKEDKLTALRHILLRFSADKVDSELQALSTQRSKVWKTQERILLALGHGPHSEKLVRIAKQMASNFRCPWYAVYVETGKELSSEDEKTLSKNLEIAREFGAKIISTSETDIVKGIDRVCHQYNITQIVIGRPGFRPIKNFLSGGSILDRLNILDNQVSINLVRTGGVSRPFNFSQYFTWLRANRWREYLYATLFVLALSIINKFVFFGFNLLSYRNIGMIFLFGVTFCGLLFRLGPTIWASLLAVQVWNVFFIPPLYTFVIESSEDITLAISFFITATVTGILTSTVKKNQNLLRDQENRTSQLYKFSQKIIESNSKKECIDNLTDSLSRFFNAQVGITLKTDKAVLDYFKHGEDWIFNRTKEWAAALWAFEKGKISGKWTDTLPESSAFFIPLIARNDIVGVIGIAPIENEGVLLIHDKEFLFSISSQLALYLQRELYHEFAMESERLKKSEKLHQTLMNSVSHEIKTPLTAIIGIVDALGKLDDKNTDSFKQLNVGLQESVNRLKRIVENILDVSRLDSGVLNLKEEWFAVVDLIENVFDQLKEDLTEFEVIKEIPPNFPLVYIDGRLFEQVIYNLVLNSIKYCETGKKILIKLEHRKHEWVLIYQDFGPGIEDQYQKLIFDKFFRIPGEKSGGSGLGLVIVKSIVELHKGKITVVKTQEGLGFELVFPSKEQPEIRSEYL